jgi:hypothetical protein
MFFPICFLLCTRHREYQNKIKSSEALNQLRSAYKASLVSHDSKL